MKRKVFIIFFTCLFIVFLIGFGLYSSKIQFIGKIEANPNIEIETVFGRRFTPLSDYEGYWKNTFINTNNLSDTINIIYKRQTISLQTIGNNVKGIKYSFNEKIQASFIYTLKTFFYLLKKHLLNLIALAIVILAFIYSLKHRNEIKQFLLKFFREAGIFIKKQNYHILIPFLVSVIPGILFFFFDKHAIKFLQLSFLQISIASFTVFIIPFFLLYFYRQLKLNPFFWISFIIIFISLYFFILPEMYLYGDSFRDDISKYFVKPLALGLSKSLATPDANYLAFFQSFFSFVILKIFSINYFPEILQIFTLICISLITSSINLQWFNKIIPSQFSRLVLSLIFPLLIFLYAQAYFFHSIPFLIALLFFYFLFYPFEYNSKIKSFFIAIFFGFYILSKPIFILFIPFLILILIKSLKDKELNKSLVFVFWIICIIIQFLVNLTGTIPEIQHSELGTHYNSSFQTHEISLYNLILYSFYIFIRLIPSMFVLGSLESNTINIIINVISFAVILFIIIHSTKKYLKHKSQFYLFRIGSVLLAYFSVLLFLKTGMDSYFTFNNSNIFELKLFELIGSGYMVPLQRYLLLAYLPLLIILMHYLVCLLKHKKRILLAFNIVSVAITITLNIAFAGAVKTYQNKYNQSLWRQYNSLITQNPNVYYLPYYDYPITSECIKNGCDRIIDVNIGKEGKIYIDSLGYDTSKWKIIQLITEYSEETKNIKQVECFNKQGKRLIFEPNFPITANYRFIIFRFDDFYEISEIKFIDAEENILSFNQSIRLIGKYE